MEAWQILCFEFICAVGYEFKRLNYAIQTCVVLPMSLAIMCNRLHHSKANFTLKISSCIISSFDSIGSNIYSTMLHFSIPNCTLS